MCKKQGKEERVKNNLTRLQDLHISATLEEKFLVGCLKPPGTYHHVQNQSRRHAQLPAQLPASRVSRNPGGSYRQERMDAVSGHEDGRQRAHKRVSTKSQRGKAREKFNRETMSIMAKQCEGLSGQHLTDFATMPSAVVKAARG